MTNGHQLPDAPPPELRFRRRISVIAAARELWQARELVRTLAERDLRARYKQAVLGFAWAVLTPLAFMIVFTLFFQGVADVDTEGVPYPLFSYLALIPWTFFSTSLSSGGQSLVTNKALLNKVYCPREVFPAASTTVAGVDALVATVMLVALFPITGYAPRAASLWIPVILALQVAFVLGITLVISVVMVYLRDLRHALPMILQLGLFATPVAFGIDAVPQSLRGLYCAINPLAAVINSYRRTVLHGQNPDWSLVIPATITTAVLLIGGYLLFKRLETGLADVA